MRLLGSRFARVGGEPRGGPAASARRREEVAAVERVVVEGRSGSGSGVLIVGREVAMALLSVCRLQRYKRREREDDVLDCHLSLLLEKKK